jgi:hypothetical protein
MVGVNQLTLFSTAQADSEVQVDFVNRIINLWQNKQGYRCKGS